jgi:hypothetical protein
MEIALAHCCSSIAWRGLNGSFSAISR